MIRTAVVALFAAVVAIVVRWPVCSESLWVDELHSAWTVGGEFDDIASRAALGNQTPWYFYFLWWWRHWMGGGELGLRLPSLIASAMAAAVLVVGVTRHGGGILGGAIAGLLLAVDRNAIFFGTETRPYAVVMLAVAVAAWSGAELRRSGSRWARAGLLVACFGGFLVHVTAAIPLAVLATVWFAWPTTATETQGAGPLGRFWRGPRHGFAHWDFLAVVVVMSLVLWINREVIFHAWEDRSQWSAFGRPRKMRELWTIWPWTWLVLLPVGFWSVVRLITAGGRDGQGGGDVTRPESPPAMVLAAVLVATLFAWAVSCWGWAPIWHRRFMVGVLPLLCAAAGGFWGAAGSMAMAQAQRWGGGKARSRLAIEIATLALVGLMSSQGTLPQWLRGDTAVRRGEDWRGAVAFLRQHRQEGDAVFVASELLESRWLDRPVEDEGAGRSEPVGPRLQEYLGYPLRGLYGVDHVIPLGTHPEYRRQRIRAEMRRRVAAAVTGEGDRENRRWDIWVVMRMRGTRALSSVAACATDPVVEPYLNSVAIHPFGKVTVVRFGFAR